MALNFHELYVLLEFWGGGEDREERGEVTLVLLKAGMSCVFCFSDSEETGKNQRKKKKNQQKRLFRTYSRDPALKPPG